MKLQEFAANKIARLNQAIDMLNDYLSTIIMEDKEVYSYDYFDEVEDVIEFLKQMKEMVI